jgi:hypothetical protein
MAEVNTAEAVIREQAAAEDFNARCNAVDAAGHKEFGDKWVQAKADLGLLGDYGGIPDALVQVALETEDPARALFELSKDLERAGDLIDLPAVKRAVAIGKLTAARPKAAPTAPKASAPAAAPKAAANDLPRDTDSDEEWNRKEELRERRLLEARRVGRPLSGTRN